MDSWDPKYDITFEQACKLAYEGMAAIPRDEHGNPLTLDGVIRAVILKNPNFAKYRDHALGVIYTVLGGCIGWHDGRLGDRTPNNYMNMPPGVGYQGCWSTDHGMSESLEELFENRPAERKEWEDRWQTEENARQQEIIRTIVDIDNRVQQYSPKPTSWYPILWYACNLCAPKDAQQDFFDGAIETCTLIVEAKPALCTQEWRTHLRTKKYAEEILSALMMRVPKVKPEPEQKEA